MENTDGIKGIESSQISTVSGAFIIRKRGLINLALILAFFPFISLIPQLGAEVQPYCYLVSLLVVLLFRVKLPLVLYLFFTFLSAYLVYYIFSSYIGYTFDFKSIPHVIIYIGPPVFFFLVHRYQHLINWRYIHISFYIWVVVGSIQHLLPALFDITGINHLLGFLIPRYSGSTMTEFGGRGVTSLSNEPSYAAILIFSAFTAVIYRYIKKDFGIGRFIIDSLLYLWCVIINASVTGFLLLFILILSGFFYKKKFLAFFIVSTLAGFTVWNVDIDIRSLMLLKELPALLAANDWNIYDVLVGSQGSIREFSTLVAIKSSFFHCWGNGYYSSFTDFINIAKSLGFDLSKVTFFMYDIVNGYVNMKPYGYGSLILFELGIIPFLLINLLVGETIANSYRNGGNYKRLGIFIACHAVIFMNFNTTASLPSYWIELLVALQIIEYGGFVPVISNEI